MEELYDKISAYLQNHLSPEEKAAFESELASDASLREEVEAHRLAAEAIEWSIADTLRQEMASWGDEASIATSGAAPAPPSTQQAKIRPLWQRHPLAIAASFLVLVIAGAFLWSNLKYSNSALAGDFYPKEELSGLRATLPDQDPLAPGYQALAIGNYSEAVKFFTKMGADPTYSDKALYFLAHAHYQQKQYAPAETALNTLIENPDSPEKERAEWLLALCYLRNQKFNEAQAMVQQIASNPDHSYYPQAKLLQADFNSIWRKMAGS